MSDEAILEQATPALKSLKKLIASRGRLQGNFYFAADSKGNVAGLVVTMTARDKSGSKAASAGKGLRKALKVTKFGRGTVAAEGSKIHFTLFSGSASPDLMKRSFKNAFTHDNLKQLKALLRKSKILRSGDRPEAAEAVDDEAVITEEEQSGLSPSLIKTLRELEADQGDLHQRNRELRASFLSEKEAEADRQERVSDLMGQVSAMLREDSVDEEALQALRYQLAEELYTGEEAFPEPGEVLPEDVSLLVNAMTVTFQGSTALYEAARDYRTALDAVEKMLAQLTTRLKKEDSSTLQNIGERGLAWMLGLGRDPLAEAIREAEEAAPEQRTAKLRVVGTKASAFLQHITDHTAVKVVDDNPFGVSVSVKVTLTPSLSRLAQATNL